MNDFTEIDVKIQKHYMSLIGFTVPISTHIIWTGFYCCNLPFIVDVLNHDNGMPNSRSKTRADVECIVRC